MEQSLLQCSCGVAEVEVGTAYFLGLYSVDGKKLPLKRLTPWIHADQKDVQHYNQLQAQEPSGVNEQLVLQALKDGVHNDFWDQVVGVGSAQG